MKYKRTMALGGALTFPIWVVPLLGVLLLVFLIGEIYDGILATLGSIEASRETRRGKKL